VLTDGEVGDDALCKIVDALNRIIETDLGRHTYHVKELNLAGNKLTTASALPLSRVVSRNTAYLQNINLARNDIVPASQDHLDNWESFLESFRNCFRINKLDLSENNFSNPKALEVFLRVYRSHKLIDNSLLYSVNVAPRAGRSDVEEMTEVMTSISVASESPTKHSPAQKESRSRKKSIHTPSRRGKTPVITDSPTPETPGRKKTTQVETPKRQRASTPLPDQGKLGVPSPARSFSFTPQTTPNTRSPMLVVRDDNANSGLRSIAYIILSDTTMGDVGALHLAYIVKQHYLPSQLSAPLRHLPSIAMMELEKRSGFECSGIMYKPNAYLSESSEKLLRGAESIRKRFSSVSQAVDEESLDFAPTTSRFNNLDSLRKKIQRATIENYGISSVQLWQTAIKLLTFARALVYKTSTKLNAVPTEVWARFLLFQVNGWGIVTLSQAEAIVEYARKKKSLKAELGCRAKDRATQIFKVLEAVGCLEYEITV
jgi:hypothetical protein